MSNSALKECPFCGGTAKLKENDADGVTFVQCRCEGCGAKAKASSYRLDLSDTTDEFLAKYKKAHRRAVLNWNMRYPYEG